MHIAKIFESVISTCCFAMRIWTRWTVRKVPCQRRRSASRGWRTCSPRILVHTKLFEARWRKKSIPHLTLTDWTKKSITIALKICCASFHDLVKQVNKSTSLRLEKCTNGQHYLQMKSWILTNLHGEAVRMLNDGGDRMLKIKCVYDD